MTASGALVGLASLAALVGLTWTLLAIRLVRKARGPMFRFVEPDPTRGEDETGPEVEAIVPARNEEAVVEATIESIRDQDYSNLSITAVDDQSTDRTASILRKLAAQDSRGRAPLKVIEGIERPEGWVGKTWAVHQGASSSRSEWLWFVDADMMLDRSALRVALALARQSDADLVSFLPGVDCRTFWQKTIAASFLHILAHLYPLDRVNDPTTADAIAAGGFLLVRRSSYDRAGGHEAVRRSIIEDIALSRIVKQSGGRLAVRLAPRLAWTHMYGSFGEIWRGLRKNAYAGMDYQPHKFVVGAMIALVMGWAPWVSAVAGFSSLLAAGSSVPVIAALLSGLLGILAQFAATLPNLVFLRIPWVYGFTLPMGISAYVAITCSSVWNYHRGRVLWKGRSIDSRIVAEVQTSPNRPAR